MHHSTSAHFPLFFYFFFVVVVWELPSYCSSSSSNCLYSQPLFGCCTLQSLCRQFQFPPFWHSSLCIERREHTVLVNSCHRHTRHDTTQGRRRKGHCSQPPKQCSRGRCMCRLALPKDKLKLNFVLIAYHGLPTNSRVPVGPRPSTCTVTIL